MFKQGKNCICAICLLRNARVKAVRKTLTKLRKVLTWLFFSSPFRYNVEESISAYLCDSSVAVAQPA